jgi:hypothetical protein
MCTSNLPQAQPGQLLCPWRRLRPDARSRTRAHCRTCTTIDGHLAAALLCCCRVWHGLAIRTSPAQPTDLLGVEHRLGRAIGCVCATSVETLLPAINPAGASQQGNKLKREFARPENGVCSEAGLAGGGQKRREPCLWIIASCGQRITSPLLKGQSVSLLSRSLPAGQPGRRERSVAPPGASGR